MLIESLESRKVLAASFSIDGSILNITGTENQDFIALGVSPDGTQFDLNFYIHGDLVVQKNFLPIKEFTLITADLGGGADTFIMGEVPIPALILGGPGYDSLSGGQGHDTLAGQGGDDYLFGREGNDSLLGGVGADIQLGGRNDDFILALSDTTGDDTISGGLGEDTVDYRLVLDEVYVHIGNDLPDPNEDDFIFGDVENIFGSPQNDTIINGTNRGMRIDGRAGNDSLTGGSGDDTLVGGFGQDVLTGNKGTDVLDAADGEADILNGGTDADEVTDDLLLDARADI